MRVLWKGFGLRGGRVRDFIQSGAGEGFVAGGWRALGFLSIEALRVQHE